MLTCPEAAALLRKAERILIVTHIRPDGDAAGSGCALCRGLRQLGKEAYLAENPVSMTRYVPFMLPYFAPEDFAPDFIVAVDTPTEKQFPPEKGFLAARTDLAIDHHGTNSGYAAHTWLEADSAATGEMIYLLLRELGVRFTDSLCEAIFAAIIGDTNGFRTPGTTARSFRIAAELRETGFDSADVMRRFLDARSPARLRLEARLFSTMRFPRPGVCVMELPYAVICDCGASEDDMDKLSVLTIAADNAEVGLLLRELPDGTYKISVRTNGHPPAGKIAAALGGGGHADAGGAVCDGPPEILLARLLNALDKLHTQK